MSHLQKTELKNPFSHYFITRQSRLDIKFLSTNLELSSFKSPSNEAFKFSFRGFSVSCVSFPWKKASLIYFCSLRFFNTCFMALTKRQKISKAKNKYIYWFLRKKVLNWLLPFDIHAIDPFPFTLISKKNDMRCIESSYLRSDQLMTGISIPSLMSTRLLKMILCHVIPLFFDWRSLVCFLPKMSL